MSTEPIKTVLNPSALAVVDQSWPGRWLVLFFFVLFFLCFFSFFFFWFQNNVKGSMNQLSTADLEN